MKLKQCSVLLALVFILAACAGQPTAAAPTESAPAVTAFKTPIGDIQYVSARFVDEVHDVKPEAGHKLLLVFLKLSDGSALDLQKFQDAQMSIFLNGDDGSETVSTMGGLVDDQFAIGFQVPEAVKTYTLVWGDNAPFVFTPGE